MKPKKLAATVSSRTTGQVREAGLAAPSSEPARSAASRPICLGVERLRRAAHAEAQAGLLVALGGGDRLEVGVARGRLVARREPGRGGERDPRLLVDVDRGLDARSARRPRAPPPRPPSRARPCARSSTRRGAGSARPGISGGVAAPFASGGAANSSGSAIRAASTASAAIAATPSSLRSVP